MNLEIERKFLIELPDADFFAAQNSLRTRRIIQTYLKEKEKLVERRIRLITEDGKTSYFYTEKMNKSGFTRLEDEREITECDYIRLEGESYSRLEKTRYSFPFAGHVIEIDVYPFEYGGVGLSGRAVMEVELKDEREEIIFPERIKIIRELTGTREFSNKSLAKRTV